MSAPLLLDLSHTCHTRARTGIQRVTRSLLAALGDRAIAITHDPYRAGWRTLQAWERANLAATDAGGKRSARWPLAAKLRGRLRRATQSRSALHSQLSLLRQASQGTAALGSSGLVVPEVFSAAVARALPAIFAQTVGPRVALFHDAIALRFPELTPTKTVGRFPGYLVELLAFDGIAAVSEDSRVALVDYWRWLGVANPPPVHAIPLGVNAPESSGSHLSLLRQASQGTATLTASPGFAGHGSRFGRLKAPSQSRGSQLPTLLSVGSIEGRKNHLALLDACERLWAGGEKFSLHLIGLANAQTGAAALARICALQSAGRPLRYDGPVSDADVTAAYAACTFTVYPSLVEGFGLPVIESLAHGKPCICSARGALGESSAGGGCVALETVDASSLSGAIARLVRSRGEIAMLGSQARTRRFKTWRDYAGEFLTWMSALPRR